MHSIPPAGIHPTMPPPPAHRAKRAVGFSAASLALLAAAVAVSLSLRQEASRVFSGGNDYEIGAHAAKLLLALSGAAQLASVVYVVLSFRWAKTAATAAMALSAAWLGVIAWWLK